jgi:hypothetical protein
MKGDTKHPQRLIASTKNRIRKDVARSDKAYFDAIDRAVLKLSDDGILI